MGKKDKITRERKAKDLAISFTKKGGLFVFFVFFGEDEKGGFEGN